MANRAPAQVPTEQLFQQRTNAKRLHTNIVTRIHGLIAGRSARADCDREIVLLDGVYERLRLLNDEYVRRGNLDAQRRQNAVEYMQQIDNARNQARQSVANYVEPAAAGRRGWNVSETIAAPPSQLRNWNVTPINMADATNQTNQANGPNHSIANVNATPPLLQDAGGQATIDLARELAGVRPREDDNTVEAQAKRRRLMLEQQLIDSRLRREQQLDELLRGQNAGDNEILELIRREDQLIALAGQNVGLGQPVSSTPNRITGPMLPIAQWQALVGPQPNVAQFAPSSNRWTKIVVQPFDGDPRKWKIFELGVGATIRDTSMPDSHKLISLQAVLVEEIRKRMAHVFTNGYSFTQAFDELKNKYGSPGLVMQAHNTHLLAALPVKQGDFNALFTIAADVREAVASVDDTHLMAFTYSTVISSIVSKLPSQLQLDWGKLAYALKPNLPSMRDLDKWLDVAVGAEEYRGNRFVAPTIAATQQRAAYPPRQQTSGSASYGAPGSSSYRQQSNIRAAAHNSTILTQSVAQGSNGTPIAACAVCKEDPGHRLDYCNIFKRMLVPQRAAAVADNNYCFRCLTKGHYGRDCRRPAEQTKCKTCGEAHNTLLHGAEMQFKKREGKHLSEVLLVRAPLKSKLQPVLLAIVPVTVCKGRCHVKSFAVLDPGSEATLVKQSLATRLGLSGAPLQIRFGSFNGYSMVESQLVSFQIDSSNGQLKVSQAFVVPDISLSLRKIDWPSLKSGWSNLAGIDLPAVDTSLVEMLIGMDQFAAHVSFDIAIEEGCPTAVKTPFGWTVVGRIPASLVSGPTSKVDVNLQSISEEISLSALAERFHSTESFGVDMQAPSTVSFEDSQALSVLERSIKFVGCGYQVDLPLVSSSLDAPNNRSQAMSRFFSLERRLTKPENADYAQKYISIIQKLFDEGVVENVPESDINSPDGMVWYLPHTFVLYPYKPGKIRVVFDWAVAFKDFVLNKHLFRGPSLIPSLAGVLLRTRQHPVAVSADIEAFYHRVGVPKEHRPLSRFVYRKFGSNEAVRTGQFTTLCFGGKHASTSAIWALRFAVAQNTEYPDVAASIDDDYYADNLSKSFETEEEAIRFSHNSIASLAKGGFNLTGFASSSRRLLETIPEKDRAASVRDLNFDALPTEYVFGLEWEPSKDQYRLRVRPMPAVATKRNLLSALSRFFDPLGICLPVTTYAKLLFQATCKTKSTITSTSSPLGWDEPLPAEILAKWNKYAAELSSLSEIFIDRCFRPKDFPLDGCVFDLLLYCDASPLAMAAIALGRFTFGEQIRFSFIMGRGRLTPSSSLTIPRLELQSCVMAVRLAETIKKELRIPIASIEFRTDSQIVIHQLLSSHLERPEFVKSRLHEILRHSTTAQWFHVSGKDNVADDATRGLTPAQFLPNCRWLTGPSLAVRAAPAVDSVALLHLEDPERPTVCAVNQLSVAPNSPVPAPMSSRTSVPAPKSSRPSVSKLISRCRNDLAHLKREVALSLRDDPKSTEPISVAELDEAMRVCLITAAEESFPREFKALRTGKKLPNDSVLRNVSPYIDPADGLLKVDGRLEHAELPEYTRHPIILAPDHRLTTLIIADAHDKIFHGGVEHTLACVRERFYLPQGRRAIRRTVGQCQKCRFNHSRNTAPRMANLPRERLRGFVRPFTITGLDLFGPFRTVIGRRVEKRWILIATCFSVRGVHLELCYSLSADSCLMAVRRFIADRGHPETIFSDNGTNLVATEKELREGLANLNSSLVTEEMINRGIDWKFSPPGGSHFGGSYERLVASCKRALLAVLGGRAVSDEVLLTVIKEIANILNSRPITRVSTDPTEEGPLTPNHFILGCHHPHAPPDAETAFDGLSRRHWKQAQFIIDQWWRRWMREYVPELIARDKWQQHTRQMRVGDEVVVIDENNRRGHWPRGFVTKTFPGDGGVIRRVAVKIGRSELIRPVIKLCLVSDL